MTMALELTEEELEILRAVQQRRISYSRGVYRHSLQQGRDVSLPVQRLRSMLLVRLVDRRPGERMQPYRRCEPTERGEVALESYA